MRSRPAQCDLRSLKETLEGIGPDCFASVSDRNHFVLDFSDLISEARSLRRKVRKCEEEIRCLKDRIFLMKYDAGVEPCETLKELSGGVGGPSLPGNGTHGAGNDKETSCLPSK